MEQEWASWLSAWLGEPSVAAWRVPGVLWMVVALGVACGLGARRLLRAGLSLRQGAACVVGALGGGGLLGHWVALAFEPGLVAREPWALLILSRAGFASLGVYAGAAAGVWLACRLRGAPFWRYADALAPGMLLAAGLARALCLFKGCDFGGVAPGLLWGLRYPRGTSAFAHLEAHGLVGPYQKVGPPMHAFPLYEALPVLVLGLALLRWPGAVGEREGQVASASAVLYCAVRVVTEGFRAQEGAAAGWSPMQGLCLLGATLFGILWWRQRRVGSEGPVC